MTTSLPRIKIFRCGSFLPISTGSHHDCESDCAVAVARRLEFPLPIQPQIHPRVAPLFITVLWRARRRGRPPLPNGEDICAVEFDNGRA